MQLYLVVVLMFILYGYLRYLAFLFGIAFVALPSLFLDTGALVVRRKVVAGRLFLTSLSLPRDFWSWWLNLSGGVKGLTGPEVPAVSCHLV